MAGGGARGRVVHLHSELKRKRALRAHRFFPTNSPRAAMVTFLSLVCFVPLLQQQLVWRNRYGQGITSSVQSLGATVGPAVLDDDLLAVVREGIADVAGDLDAWEESIALLSSEVSMNVKDAEHCLVDALGWKSWAKASKSFRKYQKPRQPNTTKLREALVWLREGPLKLNVDQLRSVIQDKPKVYLDGPEETYKMVLTSAPQKFKDPSVLNAMILDDPRVMECTYNCDIGDSGCLAECGNCWVTYGKRGR